MQIPAFFIEPVGRVLLRRPELASDRNTSAFVAKNYAPASFLLKLPVLFTKYAHENPKDRYNVLEPRFYFGSAVGKVFRGFFTRFAEYQRLGSDRRDHYRDRLSVHHG